MKDFNLRTALPYLLAIPIFYLATFMFFSPEVLKDRTLRQGDVVQYEGMSKTSREYTEKTGEQALWNISMFAGFPEYLIAGVDEGPIFWVKRLTQGFFDRDSAASLFFLSSFCSWIMLLCFGVNPYLSILGALAIALNSYNIVTIEAGHITKVRAIGYSALVLGGLRLGFRGRMLLGFALTALGLTLQLGANHYQITFYLMFVCAIYTMSEVVFWAKEKKLPVFAKQLGVVLLAVILGGLTQTARLWMTLEYSPHSIRGASELTPQNPGEESSSGLTKDYAFSWSQGTFESFTLLVPYLYGGGSQERVDMESEFAQELAKVAGRQRVRQMIENDQLMLPMYHGDQPFTAGPIYTGAINIFLFLLAMLLLEKRQRYWILAATLLMLFFAWGKNFSALNYFLFDYVPGFNKFRSVSMALSLALILIPLGAMSAIQQVVERADTDTLKKKLFLAGGITAGLCLLIFLFAGSVQVATPNDARVVEQLFGQGNQQMVNTFVDALQDDRVGLIRSDALRSFAFIAIAFVCLYMLVLGKMKPTVAILIVGGLLVLDLWMVDKRYLYESKFVRARQGQVQPPTEADKQILQDDGLQYRVFNLSPNAFQESGTSYYHRSIGGYFAAKLQRYQDLVDRQMRPELQEMVGQLQSGSTDFSGLESFNMLNAKYIKIGNNATDVIENQSAMGAAWFVEELLPVASADEEMEALTDLNLAREAVINTQQFEVGKNAVAADSTARIELVAYNNREAVYQSQSKADGFAVFSEVYYPKGWKVTIDGEEVSEQLVRVNYLLRGLPVPAGEHTISFRFEPESFEVGQAITTVSVWLVFVATLGAIGLVFFRKEKE